MANARTRKAATFIALALLLVLVTAGCANRRLPEDAGAAGAAAGQTGPTLEPQPVAVVPASPASPATAAPEATPDPTPSPAATKAPPPGATPPTAAPLAMPDLSTVERLLADLDAALGADATADAEEGTAP
jgi:hypothetical protein